MTLKAPKSSFTLAFFGLQHQDADELNRLINGLQFNSPVSVQTGNTSTADIVLVDADHQEGRQYILKKKREQKLISFGEHLSTHLDTILLHKPIRARELLNCINGVLGSIH